MSLLSIVQDAMTVAQMRSVAGATRSKGASTKDELVFGVLLALSQRGEKAVEQLPVEAQKKLRGSPVAQRELKRVATAAAACSTGLALRSVMEFFPPSILLHVLDEEMTAAQMKRVAGKERSTGASTKDELVFGVLLALATRGPTAMRDLPANAQSRIEAAPAALDWVKLLERADVEFLATVTTGLDFRSLLCKPREGADDEDDEDEAGEEGDEDEDASALKSEDEDVVSDDDDEVKAAAAKVRDLEAKLAEAKAEAGTAKASRVRSRATAADTKKKLDFAKPGTRAAAQGGS